MNITQQIKQRQSFNPHTHEGCDNQYGTFNHAWNVSIHTPTKGVTGSPETDIGRIACFNPHTHEGCDKQWSY